MVLCVLSDGLSVLWEVRRPKNQSSTPRGPDHLWGPPKYLLNVYWGTLFAEVRRPELLADPSPLSSAEIKNVRKYSSIPAYALVTWPLVKYSNFTCFTFTELG
jgi:hypothetical protein